MPALHLDVHLTPSVAQPVPTGHQSVVGHGAENRQRHPGDCRKADSRAPTDASAVPVKEVGLVWTVMTRLSNAGTHDLPRSRPSGATR